MLRRRTKNPVDLCKASSFLPSFPLFLLGILTNDDLPYLTCISHEHSTIIPDVQLAVYISPYSAISDPIIQSQLMFFENHRQSSRRSKMRACSNILSAQPFWNTFGRRYWHENAAELVVRPSKMLTYKCNKDYTEVTITKCCEKSISDAK